MDSCPEEVHFLFNNCCIHHFGSLEFTLAFFSATKFNQNSDPTPAAFSLAAYYLASSGFCPCYHISPSLLVISEMGPLTKVNRVLISIKNNSTSTSSFGQLSPPGQGCNWHLRTRWWEAEDIAGCNHSWRSPNAVGSWCSRQTVVLYFPALFPNYLWLCDLFWPIKCR